jgi:hypothetical protein
MKITEIIQYHFDEIYNQINLLEDFNEWRKENPSAGLWKYNKELPNKSELRRHRILLAKILLKEETNHFLYL